MNHPFNITYNPIKSSYQSTFSQTRTPTFEPPITTPLEPITAATTEPTAKPTTFAPFKPQTTSLPKSSLQILSLLIISYIICYNSMYIIFCFIFNIFNKCIMD